MSIDLALEFGTVMTRVADESQTIVFSEPTVAAVHERNELVAFGTPALHYGPRSAGRTRLVRPVRAGQLVDIDLAEAVLVDVLRRSGVSRVGHARVLCVVHADTTGIQRRALERGLRRAGARRVRFIEASLACAVGAGIKIAEPFGSMVLDVGGGTSDCGVIALGALASHRTLAIGSDNFDEVVRNYLARTYGVLVDRTSAAEIRRRAGSISGPPSKEVLKVVGRHSDQANLVRVQLSASEITAALRVTVAPILTAAISCITSAPPDLTNDLLESGLLLTGGGALLEGLDRALARSTGLPVHCTGHLGSLAVLGASRCLEEIPAPVRDERLAYSG